jgi:hypothetical protein
MVLLEHTGPMARRIEGSTTTIAGARLIPVAAAGAFGFLAFRGLDAGGVVWTDAARHAMNGALIHDWLREGPWLAPGAYASWYYAHWPALSLGYHPPVFPAIEAVAYFLFGVGPFAARTVVALATALSAWLMYRLVLKTHGSPAVAFAAMVAGFSLPLVQSLSRDVMLEMPALVFVLLALLALPPLDEPFTARAALLFAALAGVAVWTKQLSVFIAAVPVAMALLTGRRDWLLSRWLWLAVAACALALEGVTRFELAFGVESPRRFALSRGLEGLLRSNGEYYLNYAWTNYGILLAILAGLSLLWAIWNHQWRKFVGSDGLYIAWVAAVMAALLLGEWASTRYLFFACLPLVTLAVVAAHRSLARLTRARWADAAVVVIASAVALVGVSRAPLELPGPATAAQLVAADHPTRVLYAGESDGHFAFALRSATGDTNVIVIRGERLPPETYEAEAFEAFAARYGVSHVVLEQTRRVYSLPWTVLVERPAPSMVSLRQVAVSGYRVGALHVYRFTAPSPTPSNTLTVDSGSEKPGRTLKLDWSTPTWRAPQEQRQ